MHRRPPHCYHLLRWSWPVAGLLCLVVTAQPVGAQPSNADALRQAVRSTLAQRFPADVHRVRIRLERTGGGAGHVQQPRVRFHALDRLPRGPAQVRVYRRQDDQWQRTGWALLYVAHFDSVLVITRTVRASEPVTRSDVQVRWTETTRFRGEPLPITHIDGDTTLYATRYLREGRHLRRNDLRPPYAAHTGQSVTVRYRRGRLHLKLRCKAREPGFIGDVIRVYAPDTDAAYRARLIEPGLAEWIETL